MLFDLRADVPYARIVQQKMSSKVALGAETSLKAEHYTIGKALIVHKGQRQPAPFNC